MAVETLEFEEPIALLLKEIDNLGLQPKTAARDREIESLRRRIETVRSELYRSLTPWQRVLVARHPNRPSLEYFIEHLFIGFTEIHGDRRFADDHAIMTGFAEYKSQHVLVVGHVKGDDTKAKIYRNFGYARPEGYRKALRAMKLAEKFARPVLAFVDTPAAYPGMESEERGISEAIAFTLREMAALDTPTAVAVADDGGCGGKRGSARPRGGRPRADAPVRNLQRHPARGVRRHPLARRVAQGGSRGGVEAHRPGPARLWRGGRDRGRAGRGSAHGPGSVGCPAGRAARQGTPSRVGALERGSSRRPLPEVARDGKRWLCRELIGSGSRSRATTARRAGSSGNCGCRRSPPASSASAASATLMPPDASSL